MEQKKLSCYVQKLTQNIANLDAYDILQEHITVNQKNKGSRIRLLLYKLFTLSFSTFKQAADDK